MAELTEQTFDEKGTVLTMSSASAGGDEFVNYGKQKLLIHNSDSSSKDVTVEAQISEHDDQEYGISEVSDKTITVPAGGIVPMGTFARKSYNDSNGKCQITYSDVTSLEVAVFREDK